MSAPQIASVEAASLKGMVLGIVAYSLFALHDAMIKAVITACPCLKSCSCAPPSFSCCAWRSAGPASSSTYGAPATAS